MKSRTPDEIAEETPPARLRRRPTRAELDLWRDVMRDVLPLHHRRHRAAAAEEAAPPPAKGKDRPAPRPTQPQPPIIPAPAPGPLSRELIVGRLADVDKRNADRFRRGRMPIEARIDLHGMTQDRAHPVLSGFLARAYERGQRCVLVITGKGLRPDGSIGVLRASVPRWLNESPNRERVLGISHATAPDGGEGAYYVLLRRRR